MRGVEILKEKQDDMDFMGVSFRSSHKTRTYRNS